MGRKKISIAPIDDDRNRHVTFNKRKTGLIKKAMELSILCKCQICLIVFNQDDTLFEYTSMEPKEILEKYIKVAHVSHERLTNDDYDKMNKKSGKGKKKSKSSKKKSSSSSSSTSAAQKEKETTTTTDDNNPEQSDQFAEGEEEEDENQIPAQVQSSEFPQILTSDAKPIDVDVAHPSNLELQSSDIPQILDVVIDPSTIPSMEGDFPQVLSASDAQDIPDLPNLPTELGDLSEMLFQSMQTSLNINNLNPSVQIDQNINNQSPAIETSTQKTTGIENNANIETTSVPFADMNELEKDNTKNVTKEKRKRKYVHIEIDGEKSNKNRRKSDSGNLEIPAKKRKTSSSAIFSAHSIAETSNPSNDFEKNQNFEQAPLPQIQLNVENQDNIQKNDEDASKNSASQTNNSSSENLNPTTDRLPPSQT